MGEQEDRDGSEYLPNNNLICNLRIDRTLKCHGISAIRHIVPGTSGFSAGEYPFGFLDKIKRAIKFEWPPIFLPCTYAFQRDDRGP